MIKKLSIFLVLLFSFTPHLFADDSLDEKPVKNIIIKLEDVPPHSKFQMETVENKLKTKVGERFSQTVFDYDLKSLSKEYDKVEPKIEVHHDEVYITLKIWLRPLITEISFSGDYHYRSSKLKKELGVQTQTLYNRQNFLQGIHKLREFYNKKGYFETEINYKIDKDPTLNHVKIDVIITEGRSGRINQIDFEGFTKEEISKIKEELHIGKFNPFVSWLNGKGIYHEEMVGYDQIKVLEFLRDEGYANAKVDVIVTEIEKNNRIGILIKATKGDLFTINNVTFSGNKDYTDEIIKNKLLISQNEPYSPKKMQETANSISDFYGKKGYIDASISYEPHLIEGQNTYDVHFKIEEGAAYKVGLIKIIGNNRTFPKVILREAHLEPGNTFDTKMLEATRKRLENIGYYKHVNVYPSGTTSAHSIKAPIRDVNIQVQEASTGSLAMNVGFSTVDSVYGGIELTEKNFNLAGLADIPSRGIGALRGGGEYLKIQTSIGIKITDYSLAWAKPYFFDSLWTFGVNLDKNFSRVQSSSYSIESFTTTVNSFYPLNAFVNFNTFYRLRNTNLHASKDASQDILDQKKNNGIISSVGVGLQYETRNNFHRPTQGFNSELSVEYAGVGGDFYYFNYSYNNALYIPVSRFVFKTKANFNFIQPISKTKADQIPMGERFFSVTDISEVRGYKPFALGPLFPNGEPAGGITQVILSEEIMTNLIPKFIDIFAFVDAGALTAQPFQVNTLRVSVGAGARIIAAANLPLMLGWGYPINPQRRIDRQGFFLSLSGKF